MATNKTAKALSILTLYLSTVLAQDIWDHSGGQRKGSFPGAPDDYRETIYSRDYSDHSFEVLYSIVEEDSAKSLASAQ